MTGLHINDVLAIVCECETNIYEAAREIRALTGCDLQHSYKCIVEYIQNEGKETTLAKAVRLKKAQRIVKEELSKM